MPPFLISTVTSCLSVMTEFCPLTEKEPEFTHPVSPGWFRLWGNSFMAIDLVEFDMARAIASLNSAERVIPLWLDRINLELSKKVESKKEGY
ncbi:hypothetical protein QUA69_11525 [Microcoleus sp. LAD1_D1]|uniref:hypothetical protein n=1 Tax=Microcoleus sp. LAD1_D1 TaxID=2818812 RepID=UPI002FD641BE